MNKAGKTIIIVFIVFLLAIGGLFIFFLYKDMKDKQNDKSGNIVEEVNKQDVSDIPEDESIDKSTDNATDESDLENSNVSHDREIASIIKNMTVEEKVGQMFFVRCPETDTISPASKYYVGGYLLFARDFENKTAKEVTNNVASYQASSKIKLVVGVDEEGGTVTRVSKYSQFRSSKFKSPRDLYAEGGMNLLISDSDEKCDLLSSLGINVIFAPVCDVSTNKSDYMYSRSIGLSAEETGDYVAKVVEAMNSKKMGSVLKHFPGYGSNSDTHTGISVDERSLEQFENCDLIPFESGIEAGAGCILVSHNIINCMDTNMPSSLSKAVHDYLRNKLNYEGVIITDDLAMDAIQNYIDPEKAGIYAVEAGNDMIICTDFKTQIPNVIQAVKNGDISEEQLNKAVERILKWKRDVIGLNIT